MIGRYFDCADSLIYESSVIVIYESLVSYSFTFLVMATRTTRRLAAPLMSQLVEADDSESNSDDSEEEEDVILSDYSSDDSSESVSESVHTESQTTVFIARRGAMQWNTQPPLQRRRRATDIVRHAGGPNYTRQTIVDTFSLFCSDEIFERIVYYTNLHADNAISEGWYRERWIPVDLMETKAFVGCLLFIGVHRSRHESYESLWSNENGRQYLKATMSLMRFKMLLKFIRFDDKETRSQRRSNDKLSAFREIFELFLSRCRSSYTVGAYCTVDEQLVGFRGRCPFRVYMPNKPNKYGMKIWLLCDSENAYVFNGQIYLGKEGHLPEVGQAQRIVVDLVRPLFGAGRNVTTDNYFTSVSLANSLLKERTTILGTLRANKCEIPDQFQKNRAREVHSTQFGFTKDLTLCSYVPKKGKAVILLSSMHHDAAISSREDKKPEMIMQYNATKGAVDTADQYIQTYSCSRQSRRWPTKLFFNVLDIGALNSYLVWMKNNPNWNAARRYRRRLFLIELSTSLMKPLILRRAHQPRLQISVRQAIEACGVNLPAQPNEEREELPSRGRCHLCRLRNQVKVRCNECQRFVCKEHSERKIVCNSCL